MKLVRGLVLALMFIPAFGSKLIAETRPEKEANFLSFCGQHAEQVHITSSLNLISNGSYYDQIENFFANLSFSQGKEFQRIHRSLVSIWSQIDSMTHSAPNNVIKAPVSCPSAKPVECYVASCAVPFAGAECLTLDLTSLKESRKAKVEKFVRVARQGLNRARITSGNERQSNYLLQKLPQLRQDLSVYPSETGFMTLCE